VSCSEKLDAYIEARTILPERNLAWRLYGAGLDNFGDNGHPAVLPMPSVGDDELLARVDAVGLCFSDVKLITQGSSHPRIVGRNLIEKPVIPGHEVALTIVGVGKRLQDIFSIGQRFVMQADVYYRGVNVAFGYQLAGGTQQFVILGEEVLRGDEGCYLIPVQSDTGYAEAALTEPWACVIASYRINPRRGFKDGGTALFIGPAGKSKYLFPEGKPAKVILAGVGHSVDRNRFEGAEILEIGDLRPSDVKMLSQERTGERGFDDILVLSDCSREMIEALDRSAARGAVINLVGFESREFEASIDVGRVHYDGVLYVGGRDIIDGYTDTRSSELKSGGADWFVGAAGPMGVMHVERALLVKDGPANILATDVDSNRLLELQGRTEFAALARGRKILFVNPNENGQDALYNAVDELTSGKGFDDIVVLAPVAGLIGEASKMLADGGVLNIFAGVPRGTIAEMDVASVYRRRVRWMGSSGSRPADLVYTLNLAESGEIATNRSVAAIGGIDAVLDGMRAVKNALFPGKIVIYPQILGFPLTAITDLKELLPSVYEKMEDGRFWTNEAEKELLCIMLEKQSAYL